MPKATEALTSQNYYRISPLSVASDISSPRQYPSIAATMQSSQHMSQSNLSPYTNGGPVQPPQYHHQQLSHSVTQPTRPSSGAWTPSDDTQLMNARAQGLNWQPIQAQYFPNKTANACRKRHERLMDRRNSDDWDTIKLENMAKEYMGMRREIWTQLGNKTGEKWNVVEAKCMQSGLKNLQSAARACARRERLENPAHPSAQHPLQHLQHPHHQGNLSSSSSGSGSSLLPVQPYSADQHGTDDSGIGLDDLEAEYQSAGGDAASYGGQSAASASPDDREGLGRLAPVRPYPAPVGAGGGYDVRGMGGIGPDGYPVGGQMMGGAGRERTGMDARGYAVGGQGGQQQQRSSYGMRLPSIDMGIGRLINQAPGSM